MSKAEDGVVPDEVIDEPVILTALFAIGMAPAIVFADELNMPVGVTSTSREIYDLHMLIFWICVAIGVVVFGAMLYSMIAHRKSVGHEPRAFMKVQKLELAWTIVPVFILIGMAIPATDVLAECTTPAARTW